MTLPCRHLFYLMLSTLFTTLYRCPQALPRHVGKRTTDRKVSARGLRRNRWFGRRGNEGLDNAKGSAASGRALLSCLEKNKLPGEAVPEPGAKWDGCASILPRKQPDTVCIQRGDKHHFRGDRFDLPCIPHRGGGYRQIDQGCVGREANDATLPTITVRPDRCDRDSLLQKPSASFISGRAVRERASLGGSFATRSHASQSKLEKQIYQSVRFRIISLPIRFLEGGDGRRLGQK